MKPYALMFLFAFSLTSFSQAGEIYKCKGKNGEVIYTNVQCPDAASAVHVGSYQAVRDDPRTQMQAAHEDRDPSSVQESTSQSNPSPAAQGYGTDSSSSQGDTAAAYRCQAGGKTWISRTPCPDSVTSHHTETGSFIGNDQYGDPVDGTVTRRVTDTHQVQQQGLSKSDLCKQLDNHTDTSYTGDRKRKAFHDDSIYERNKLRQEQGC